MQIHELNNFTGTLGSGAYLAVDDGNDTGKLSTQQLLAATEARIDNIIAGPAPSAQEVTDARLGADGVVYPSLGDAIRDQVTDLKSDIELISAEVQLPVTMLELGEVTTGYMATVNNGNVSLQPVNNDRYGYYKIAVQGGERVCLYGVTYYGMLAYIVTDANGKALIYPSAKNDNHYYSESFEGQLPSNARYIYFPYRDIWTNLADTSTDIRNVCSTAFMYVAESIESRLDKTINGAVLTNFGGLRYILTEYANSKYTIKQVYKGESVFVHGFNIYAVPAFVYFDNEFNVLSMSSLENVSASEAVDTVVEITEDGFIVTNIYNSANASTAYILPNSTQLNKKWSAIGDSLTDPSTLNGKPNYFNFVSNELGLSAENFGVGGTGFWNGGNYGAGSDNFHSRALTIPSDSELVTVFGSFNDLGGTGVPQLGTAEDTGTNTIAGCMVQTIVNIRNVAPYAKILVIAPTPWNTANSVTTPATWVRINPNDYVNVLKAVCEKYNVPFLDLYHASGLAPWIEAIRDEFTLDGTHPNSKGHFEFIYPLVANKIASMY